VRVADRQRRLRSSGNFAAGVQVAEAHEVRGRRSGQQVLLAAADVAVALGNGPWMWPLLMFDVRPLN